MFRHDGLGFIAGATFLPETCLQLLLLGVEGIAPGFQILLLLPPTAMGFGKGFHSLLEGLFLALESLQLICQALARHLPLSVLLQQGVALTAGRLQCSICLFQGVLEGLPAFGVTVGFHLGVLLIQLLELGLQRRQRCLDVLEATVLLAACLLQFLKPALTLLQAFQQGAVGAARCLAFRLQGCLALLKLAQSRALLLNLCRQALLFPAAGSQGFSQLQEALAQGSRFVTLIAYAEAQAAAALAQASPGHGSALFQQLALEGDGTGAAQDASSTAQVCEDLGVPEHIGEHLAVNRLVPDQVDGSADQAIGVATVRSASTGHGGAATTAGGPNLVQWQKGKTSGSAAFQ